MLTNVIDLIKFFIHKFWQFLSSIVFAHLLSVDKAGSGIFITLRKYRYAIALTLLSDLAFAMSSEDQTTRFWFGFKSILICPGVKICCSIFWAFSSILSFFSRSFSRSDCISAFFIFANSSCRFFLKIY